MEARNALTVALIFCLTGLIAETCLAQRGFQVTTENFIVNAPDSRMARDIGRLAEKFRRELSIDWLGYEIPTWKERCPINVQIAMHAGGETSFAFVENGTGKGTPISWRMRIFGPPERILDAVLPHEITHTIFATHFGRPLPRWADEGACTTVEHSSERAKNHRMLIDFLTAKPSRGIPFNRMFIMREYPHDILPLYAQGYSLARFLIHLKGRKQFINYIETGLENEVPGREVRSWDLATNEFYGFENLSELQVQWLDWVGKGSKDTKPPETYAVAKAESVKIPREQNDVVDVNESWYVRESLVRDPERIAAQRQTFTIPSRKSSATTDELLNIRPKTIWR